MSQYDDEHDRIWDEAPRQIRLMLLGTALSLIGLGVMLFGILTLSGWWVLASIPVLLLSDWVDAKVGKPWCLDEDCFECRETEREFEAKWANRRLRAPEWFAQANDRLWLPLLTVSALVMLAKDWWPSAMPVLTAVGFVPLLVLVAASYRAWSKVPRCVQCRKPVEKHTSGRCPDHSGRHLEVLG